jgi:hypothetical protein
MTASDHIAAFKQDYPDVWEYLLGHPDDPFCNRMHARLSEGREIYPNALAALRLKIVVARAQGRSRKMRRTR